MTELSETREDLQSYWNGLQAQWQTSRQLWRDGVGDHFEREFWAFQEAEMSKLLRTMENLDESLEHAFRQTEEP